MEIGREAPDFTLPLQSGSEFRLRDYRGKSNVVLYFYPRDFTWGCTKEGCTFANNAVEIEQLHAVIVGVSPDSVESHEEFADTYHLPFALASDVRLEVCRLYDAVWVWGRAVRRVTYVIDRRGIIRGKASYEILIGKHWMYVKKILLELNREEAMGQSLQ